MCSNYSLIQFFTPSSARITDLNFAYRALLIHYVPLYFSVAVSNKIVSEVFTTIKSGDKNNQLSMCIPM